jgi:tetraprenyl-beta-curcumene synthase
VAGVELTWGLRAVSREIARWRARALEIPDRPLRLDALRVLAHKRTHVQGAAMFWTLPRRRNRDLLRLLVAYELIWDFLDDVNERGASAGVDNGVQLHLAVPEAVDPRAPISDYYRHHTSQADGGFLRALVETCRECCAALPSYPLVRDLIVAESGRSRVLALNHHPDPHTCEAELKRWAGEEFPAERRVGWWEVSAAASSPMGIHALFALAAEPTCSEGDVARTHAAYFPWLTATTTMLDSYVDQAEDLASGVHSYLAHYPDDQSALSGIRTLVRRSLTEARDLSNGHRHAVLAAAMVAMYLSKDAARSPELRASTAGLLREAGALTRLLLPILRAWRLLYAQSSS